MEMCGQVFMRSGTVVASVSRLKFYMRMAITHVALTSPYCALSGMCSVGDYPEASTLPPIGSCGHHSTFVVSKVVKFWHASRLRIQHVCSGFGCRLDVNSGTSARQLDNDVRSTERPLWAARPG